jgi:ribosomal protein S18 acetylase RimI-like enzyme
MPSPIVVRDAVERDRGWVVKTARDVLGDEYQVHSRRQFNVLDGNPLVAERNGRPIGFLSWLADVDGTEVLAIACAERGVGAGTVLMRAVEQIARNAGSARVHLVTTDTNVGAQRFYEHLGYELVERRIGAVDACRAKHKPTIPPDMHDELVYARTV